LFTQFDENHTYFGNTNYGKENNQFGISTCTYKQQQTHIWCSMSFLNPSALFTKWLTPPKYENLLIFLITSPCHLTNSNNKEILKNFNDNLNFKS
jgi:hypothetical protein